MKKICPLIKDACLEHGCEFYTHLVGKHPQSEASVDQWACAISWLPVMLVENAQMTRQASASTDKIANEISKATQLVALAMQRADMNKGRLLQGDKKAKKIDLKENGK